VIVLVFLETVKGWLRLWRDRRHRPVLNLTNDPDVDIGYELAAVGTSSTPIPTAYVRLGVENARGRRAAEAVEVTVKHVEQIAAPPNTMFAEPTHNMGPSGGRIASRSSTSSARA
jgi:hypothetical protein